MAFRLPLALACALLAASPSVAETVDVRAGRLIDPESGQVSTDQRIRIVDGKIVAISPWKSGDGPATIDWSNRQLRRWGSCTVSEGRIRISDRLASMPDWVLDWVILHELAHLVVPHHGPPFQQIVSQYQLGERAEGYLIARSEICP